MLDPIKLRAARKAKGWTQSELASAISRLPTYPGTGIMPYTTIANYEREKILSDPQLRTAECIAEALGVELLSLLSPNPIIKDKVDAITREGQEARGALRMAKRREGSRVAYRKAKESNAA